MRPAVERGAIPARYSSPGVGGPATLPERVEAESRDEIGPAFDAVMTSADTSDETRPHVYPGRDAQAESRFDAGCAGDDRVYPSFHLERLLGRLRERRCRDQQRKPKRHAEKEAMWRLH